jgi:negative regulator of sigma E activity
MKNRVREDISAYLDGEAKDAQSIARLIAESEDASKEHLALAELSSRIRNLEAPEVHPAFATRVCAAIEEQRERRRIAWRIPASLAAAAAVLLVAYVSVNSAGPRTPEAPLGSIAEMRDPATVVAKDEDSLLAEFDRRIAQDSDVQQFVVARFDNTGSTADIYTDRLLTAIANSDGAAAAGAAFAHGIDYRTTVQQLDGDQAAALKQVLAASMREALEG